MEANGHWFPCILVVDALDECNDDRDIGMILQLLAKARTLKAAQLRVFLTSRPEVRIRHGVSEMLNADHEDFILHDISRSIVDHDISIFLENNLNVIAQERSLYSAWPGKEIIKRMVQIASGLFIWAATACKFIREGQQLTDERLYTILQGSAGTATAPEQHLDEIYITVLKQSLSPKFTEKERGELCHILRYVLRSIVILSSPLSVSSLSILLSRTKEHINQTLDNLHSILDVLKDETHPLRFRTCNYSHLYALIHDLRRFAVYSLPAIERAPLQVYSSALIFAPAKSIVREQFADSIPRWIQNLPRVLEEWNAALTTLKGHSGPVTAVAFSPDGKQLASALDDRTVRLWDGQSGKALKTLKGHSDWVIAVAFSPDGRPVGQGAKDARGPQRLGHSRRFLAGWQAAGVCFRQRHRQAVGRPVGQGAKDDQGPQRLGQSRRFLAGWQAASVTAVAFSPDGKQLTSASRDGTVRLWDGQSGKALKTLEGHSDWVTAVAFSPDSKQLASASDNGTVRLWDGQSGKALKTLEGHSGWVTAVAFSPDGKQLASALGDRTVRLWDGQSAVAFSRDGKQLASALDNGTVRLWDGQSGKALKTIEGHSDWVRAVAFSPDGKQLASTLDDRTVRLWDGQSGKALKTLKGHSDLVIAVAFSPDG
ncbi:MAG: hypothetical protein Q9160_009345, partial [Pyrenula sp. 1 TL-2023]